jgi:uncharacterized membrane-anchored protein
MPDTMARPLNRDGLGWLKARERKVLLITAAAQLLILVAMIALRAIPLLTGQSVLVKVVPVDPRELFRGDYVRLSYDFSRVPPENVQDRPASWDSRPSRWEGQTVYVPLVPDSDRVHWHALKATAVKPATGLFLKGQLTGYGTMLFGIEAYYVPEGTGLRYEQAIGKRQLSAELAITSGGQAALRGLRIE